MAEKTFDQCYWFDYDSFQDICLYEVGSFCCPPGYSYGPIIRDTHILHYVRRGRGKLVYRDKTYQIAANCIFVIREGDMGYYEADAEEPWEYLWIRFRGYKADALLKKAHITAYAPVLDVRERAESIGGRMDAILKNYEKEYEAVGTVFGLFQDILDCVNPGNEYRREGGSVEYVQLVYNYIHQKYAEPISIQEISDYCGVNRSYLSRIFQAAAKQSPQQYLLRYRVGKARSLLEETDLPVLEVAYSVGYRDPFAFSKMFKQIVGVSPSEYRRTAH